ncbi:MAG: serine protein kinase PrkA [Deltaproteobacteria bacterium]|nr:serine protein kinase PrkA [Deltaproteobacteria bacterium]
MDTSELLRSLATRVKESFDRDRTVLPLDEYLTLVLQHPRVHVRGSAQFLADAVEHFGSYEVHRPYGTVARHKLFDVPTEEGEGRVAGQESVQQELVKHLRNFTRSGRTDRLLLLHGPNGSAKSSLLQCVETAAEAYSRTPQGAQYRFAWVFPTSKVQKGSLGFGSDRPGASLGSYALLESKDLDARIPCNMKDHPLLLIPRPERQALIKRLFDDKKLPADFQVPQVLLRGDVCPRCRSIFDALLNSHAGDVAEVLRHVQVERFYLSKRFRCGIVSVEPQMSVDGYTRQITADKSYGNLPVSLQSVVLHEAGGPLVDANRGLLEFNDLLKRPVEAFKYLLSATETQSASLEMMTVFLDTVMVATSNEGHLDAFKAYPDWQSFKGRIELVTAPYLLRFSDETQIYREMVKRSVLDRHVAPHAVEVAARFAVLTRLEPPDPSLYPPHLREVVSELKPAEKLMLYEDGTVPDHLTTQQGKELRKVIPDLYAERASQSEYEGRYGASAREIRAVLLAAAGNRAHKCLSPLAVVEELRALVKETTVYEWLGRDRKRGYRDAGAFVDEVEKFHLDTVDEEVRTAMGLVEEQSTVDLFERYVRNITAWVKGEKVPDPHTKQMRDPDRDLMRLIEDVLLPKGDDEGGFRRALIGTIGAHSLDRPAGEKPDYREIFAPHLRRLKDDAYEKRRRQVRKIAQNYLKVVHGEAKDLDTREREAVDQFTARLMRDAGYCEHCAQDTVGYLVKKRYVE